MVISGGTSNPITGPTVQDYPSTSSSNGGNIISGLVGGIGSIFDFIQGYQNLQLQQDMLNYQKQMQRTAWKREDNAIYRRTLDMRMAGLSPTLAAGNGAQSSAPIKLSTPQSNIPNPVTSALEVASAIKGIEHQQASISRTEAETRNIDLQSNKTAKETAIMEETHPYKLR